MGLATNGGQVGGAGQVLAGSQQREEEAEDALAICLFFFISSLEW